MSLHSQHWRGHFPDLARQVPERWINWLPCARIDRYICWWQRWGGWWSRFRSWRYLMSEWCQNDGSSMVILSFFCAMFNPGVRKKARHLVSEACAKEIGKNQWSVPPVPACKDFMREHRAFRLNLGLNIDPMVRLYQFVPFITAVDFIVGCISAQGGGVPSWCWTKGTRCWMMASKRRWFSSEGRRFAQRHRLSTGSCLNHFFSRGIRRFPWRCFRILDFTEWKKAQGLALQYSQWKHDISWFKPMNFRFPLSLQSTKHHIAPGKSDGLWSIIFKYLKQFGGP